MLLKNKTCSKIAQLCTEARRIGAIPKDITVTTDEATEIINEYHLMLQSEVSKAFVCNQIRVTTKRRIDLKDKYHPSELLKILKESERTSLHDSTVRQIILNWQKGQIQITFMDEQNEIPLLVAVKEWTH